MDSPYRRPLWEFLVTPYLLILMVLVRILAFIAPYAYEVTFTVSVLTEDEMRELEEYDDDYDD